jgi:hypothetical protein
MLTLSLKTIVAGLLIFSHSLPLLAQSRDRHYMQQSQERARAQLNAKTAAVAAIENGGADEMKQKLEQFAKRVKAAVSMDTKNSLIREGSTMIREARAMASKLPGSSNSYIKIVAGIVTLATAMGVSAKTNQKVVKESKPAVDEQSEFDSERQATITYQQSAPQTSAAIK